MPLTRCELTYEVDWNDDGDFTDAGDDVTADRVSFDVQFGGQARANPERPTLESARGHLALFGDRYVRGKHGALPRDVLLKRHRVRVRCGAETIWTGWMENPRSSARRTVSWELQGLLAKPLSDPADINQIDTSATTLTDSVLSGVAGAVGAAAVSPLEIPSTPLGVYGFDGPAGEYVSQFAAVAGGIPLETAAGGLGLVSPTANPGSQGTLRGDMLVIRGVQVEPALEHLRNEISAETVDAMIVSEALSAPAYTVAAAADIYAGVPAWPPDDSDYFDQVIPVDLPELNDGSTYLSGDVSFGATTARFRDRFSQTTVTQGAYNESAAYTGGTVAVNKATGGSGAVSITVPGSNIAALRPSTSLPNYLVQSQLSIGFAITMSVRRVTGTTLHTARDTQSIDDWGERSIEYPAWFRAPVTASLAARLGGLKDPRRFITVTLPLWQRDQARLDQVRDFAPGDYLGVHITDGPSDVYLNDRVVVLAVGYRQRGRRIPTKTLHLLETGVGGVFDHFRWGTSTWGGTDTWG